MADGDYYASYDDVRHLLMNSNLGVAGNTLFDADAVDLALSLIEAQIHLYIYNDNTTTKLTGTYATLLKGIELDIIKMHILSSRFFQEQNLVDQGALQAFWTITPYFTYQHRQILEMIRNATQKRTFAYSTRGDGEQ